MPKGGVSMTVLHYIHHAAFSLNDGKTTLLFDPYLENNPEAYRLVTSKPIISLSATSTATT